MANVRFVHSVRGPIQLLDDGLQSFIVLSDTYVGRVVLMMSRFVRSFKQRLLSPTFSLFREIKN